MPRPASPVAALPVAPAGRLSRLSCWPPSLAAPRVLRRHARSRAGPRRAAAAPARPPVTIRDASTGSASPRRGGDGRRPARRTRCSYAIANENPATKDLATDLATTFGAREPFFTPHRPHAAARRRKRPRHPPRLRRRRVGRHAPRRHDVQRHEDVPVDGGGPGLAARPHPRRDRSRRASTCRGVAATSIGHNATITWDHLLRQTSDWQGTLWGKPDWADRPEGERPGRLAEPEAVRAGHAVQVQRRAGEPAGPGWRCNVWRRPLPEVLRDEVMDPIGASNTWRWHGYENSWVELDGQRMQSMTGGGHWGGGMFISAWDMARFGYLFLRQGRWNEPADCVRTVDCRGADWRPGERRVRLHELVPEPRPQIAALGAGVERHVPWQRAEHHLSRPGQRPGGGRAVGSGAVRRWTSSWGRSSGRSPRPREAAASHGDAAAAPTSRRSAPSAGGDVAARLSTMRLR